MKVTAVAVSLPLVCGFAPSDAEWKAWQRRALEHARSDRVVAMALAIDEEGRVRDCNVVGSSGNPRVDEETCKMASEHLRFVPKVENGRRVPATVNFNFRYKAVE